MGLEYLKITPEIMLKISAYDEEAQGRLILAMIAYALNGTEPQFDGAEKFIWPTLRMDIDNCSAHVEKQKANGNKGGRPPKSETQQSTAETQRNPDKPSETQTKPSESLNINTNTNTKNKYKEEECNTRAREAATTTGEAVEAFNGEDLAEDIRINAEVDALLRKYGLSEAVRGDLLDDVVQHGLEKVTRVMHEASQSDTKGGLSIRFIRACLANDGKPKPARAAPAQAKDQMLRYTPEERRKTYSAAVLDFDEVT